jgi:hypothetical protein
MSGKQPEERPLSKAPSRQPSRPPSSSRLPSSSRPRSTSEQGRAPPEQGRAPPSVAGSDASDQELQRIVRDGSSEELVNEYVRRRFQSYLDNNVEDVDL